MDELEKLMLELGTENYVDDMEYLQYLLEKEKERKERILQMLALFFAMRSSNRKLTKAINVEIEGMFSEIKKSIFGIIEDRHKNTFLKSTFNIGKTYGLVEKVVVPDLPDIKWHIGNQSYIDDLAFYENRLKYDLRKNIDRGILLNQSTNEVLSIVEKPFKTLENSTKSMIDTELTYIERQANSDAYESQGIKKYRYVATLDTVTCSKCAELDGKTFNLKDKMVGVNYPPLHPHCRCVTVGDIDYKQRAAREGLGKTIYVDGNMKYEEWKKENGL